MNEFFFKYENSSIKLQYDEMETIYKRNVMQGIMPRRSTNLKQTFQPATGDNRTETVEGRQLFRAVRLGSHRNIKYAAY